ncbi:MAG TPA: glycosyltransferase [Actinophytocola sp.]|uniref:glycosyltransferase n=1 Tax=Actinophytocola sp. TaxID=1872138 RepID=UPI002DBE54B4|nr:glycosyltransferase [Actinophytocola sp.]HEU5470503.1 glycosyltransferase [Actinophytocola sp.]
MKAGRLRVLVWPVHGSWLDAFVRGGHEYLLPTLPEGGPWGGGRAGRELPDSVTEVPAAELADAGVDVVVLQRPEELGFAARWLRRTPGRDVPAIYVEHDTPRGDVPDTRHPVADRRDLCLVHVTHFNDLMWDVGTTPTTVIEHGVVDPGHRYSGELARAAVVVDEPLRHWRLTGTDLLPRFAEGAELDVFGRGLAGLNGAVNLGEHRLHPVGDLAPGKLHDAMARRRVYLHTVRWTSLGASLLEAMHLGMPVVALATTETVRAVPQEAGVVSTRIDDLTAALRELVADRPRANQLGKHAREYALNNYGLARFLRRWDDLLRHTAR